METGTTGEAGLMTVHGTIKLYKMRYKEIPENWEELTPRQFKYFLKLLTRSFSREDITHRDILCDFADFLLGRRKFLLPNMQERYLALVFQIADNLEWMFEIDDTGKHQVNFCTTENLLPTLDGLVGPQSHGSDLAFGEYRKAVEFYNAFTLTHEPGALNALVGILYREPHRNKQDYAIHGSRRQPYNQYLISDYAINAAGISDYLQYGVYLWFGYFCRFIVDGGVFTIEGNDVCFSEIFERGEVDEDAPVGNSIGMLSVLFTLADSGTFGNEAQTDKVELFKVLLKLLHDKETTDRIQRS